MLVSFFRNVVRDPIPKSAPFSHNSFRERLGGWLFYQFVVWGVALIAFFETPIPTINWFISSLVGWVAWCILGNLPIIGAAPNGFLYFAFNLLTSLVIFRYYAEWRLRRR
jgi:hypothetical protein